MTLKLKPGLSLRSWTEAGGKAESLIVAPKKQTIISCY